MSGLANEWRVVPFTATGDRGSTGGVASQSVGYRGADARQAAGNGDPWFVRLTCPEMSCLPPNHPFLCLSEGTGGVKTVFSVADSHLHKAVPTLC